MEFLLSLASPQSALDAAGPQAAQVERLWWVLFWVCTVIFVLVITLLLIAVFKRRKTGENDPGSEARKRLVITSGAIISILILFAFLIESFFVGRALTAELNHKDGVVIQLTGHQWWWEVRYQNVDAQNIFTTANEIHIPVGTPVTLDLKSTDVIHSFWVPNLSGKKDLIPGKISRVWLQADRPGLYRGQCAEYCGHQHAHMAFWVIAESPEEFQRWMASQVASSIQPNTDTQKRGQQVFLSSACVMCHAINGTPAGSNIGPNLTHIGSQKTIAAGTLQNTRDNLSAWITNSQNIKPGNHMPPNNLSSDDLQALIDYLQSLK